MAKKVLVLSSSPRKGGNSDTLCDQFMAGARAAGHRAEKVRFDELNINYCTGCGACFRTRRCSQKDDMAGVLDKMEAADVIVLATPVYFYAMAAQMKTFIDRTCARYRDIRDKAFYFILTAAEEDRERMQPTVDGFRAFVSLLEGSREQGVVYGLGAWEAGDIRRCPAMGEAYELGRTLA